MACARLPLFVGHFVTQGASIVLLGISPIVEISVSAELCWLFPSSTLSLDVRLLWGDRDNRLPARSQT
jgi:hypothetical protein